VQPEQLESLNVIATPSGSQRPSLEAALDSPELVWGDVRTKADGPAGALPLTDEMLRHWPSRDLFSLSQNAGMGWEAHAVARDPFLILSTQGGLRAPDGTPIALGYHTGHWEIGLLVQEAAEELKRQGVVPFAGMVSDPCDGRTQGTAGMMDSLPYRNDAAIVFRRLIRSLPRRKGVLGIATCDKGLPAMAIALAGSHDLACVLVPGGVTLPPRDGEDAGKVQSFGARYAHGELSLEKAAELGCRACASPGGGCQFLGTAATSQVVVEALGMTLPHAALVPSGPADLARHGPPLGPGARRPRRARDHVPPDSHGCRDPQRHVRPRGLRRFHESAAAHSGHRLHRRTASPHGR
jgi:dihydroxyacid dehydratase/phosphogluconate dehydratase